MRIIAKRGGFANEMRTEYTCPLELVHDMIKGEVEADYIMAATFRGYFSCEAGKRYRRNYTKNAVGAFERTD